MDTTKVIYSVIGIVVLMLVIAAIIPTLNTGVSTVGNISGLPLASLFAKNGVIILIFMAAVLLAVVAALKFGGKKH
jgi:hypothetical protein